MGQTLIILHDVRLAFELMEKRSVKHSSRPKQTFAGEMYANNLTRMKSICSIITDYFQVRLGKFARSFAIQQSLQIASQEHVQSSRVAGGFGTIQPSTGG
jgi:hypothetical protein